MPNVLEPGDEVAVIAFSDSPKMLLDFTEDKTKVRAGLNGGFVLLIVSQTLTKRLLRMLPIQFISVVLPISMIRFMLLPRI